MPKPRLSQDRIESRIKDTFSRARAFHWTHEELLRYVKFFVYDELASTTPSGRKRYSAYDSAFARGYVRALYDALWSEVEFCYKDADGVLYSINSQSTHRKTEEFYASGRGAELGSMPGAHYWKGTFKPYTTPATVLDI